MMVTPIVIVAFGTVLKGLVKRLKELEITKNIEESLRDLRRLVVTQTLVKDHQLTLV